ncbi:hypothetical protein DSL92_06610 [Billgrantia gudaonensis]|uniref:Uncharacterized protein n=1 Tax=Billgrantia gudaonensis TaxID=376427 RepID=A0A3S0NH77_9GAMM|nr:hypothetical protein DSL92_06610 [Halomonas gudaonensis]
MPSGIRVGCHAEFVEPARTARFDPSSDRLRLVGDLVTAAPLAGLREVRALLSAVTLFGNHDLAPAGGGSRGRFCSTAVKDNLDGIPEALDRSAARLAAYQPAAGAPGTTRPTLVAVKSGRWSRPSGHWEVTRAGR